MVSIQMEDWIRGRQEFHFFQWMTIKSLQRFYTSEVMHYFLKVSEVSWVWWCVPLIPLKDSGWGGEQIANSDVSLIYRASFKTVRDT